MYCVNVMLLRFVGKCSIAWKLLHLKYLILFFHSHPGNRHFRDVIAIHRLDFIDADTMDKPAVVHKIVKAIRQGFPVGRFLEKGDDGSYYDVGDRSAVEMTTNHLSDDERAINEAVEEEAIRMLEQFSVLSL